MEDFIFKNNMDVLKEKYTEIYDKINEYVFTNERVFVDKSVKEEDIIAVKKEEHLYYLSSRYNDAEYVKECIEKYKKIKFNEILFIFGVSNFKFIKELSEYLRDDNILMIYEPDIEIFINAIHITDIAEVLMKKNILLCIKNVNDRCFEEFNLFVLNYSNIKLFNRIIMQNYEELYPEELQEVLMLIKHTYRTEIFDRNTLIRFSKDILENSLTNSRDMIEQYTVNQLINSINSVEMLDKIPAIVVSAGPSLNKNIKYLKGVEKRAFIIVVDTALRTVFENGIKPDVVITIDPIKPTILFMHKEFYEVPLVTSYGANSMLRHVHKGKRIYFHAGGVYIKYLYEKFRNDKFQMLETGGSVANDAFSLANILGFKKVILIGQDLAYPDNQVHATEAFMGTEKKIDSEDSKYCETEDIYGNKVLTEANMLNYKEWFEQQMVRYPHLEVIDATEGGAKIKGAEILSLKEAIERECNTEMDKSFLNNIDKTFSEEQTEILREEIENIEVGLKELRKKMKRGVRKYEKLEELYRRGKIASNEFKKVMKDIDEIIEKINDEPLMEFINAYSLEDEYMVLGKVFDIKEDIKDEIRDIVNNGIKMFDSYIKGIDEFEKKIEDRRFVNMKEYKNVADSLLNDLENLYKYVDENDIAAINDFMKTFCERVILLIDRQERYKMNEYCQSVNAFKKVFDKYNDKNYKEMLEVINTELLYNISKPCENINEEV